MCTLGLTLGLTAALTAGLTTPIDAHTTTSPAAALHTDRMTALYQAPAYGLAVGLAFVLVNAGLVFGLGIGLAAGIAVGLAGAAWGQWLVFARLWLPLTGRLPWAVMAFFADAHDRGVFRQAGAVYQFRHARLQDHLAANHDQQRRRYRPPSRRTPDQPHTQQYRRPG
jgi:hypothetical protein